MNAMEILVKVETAIGDAGHASIWNDKRVYIKLNAMQRSYRGDSSRQFYIDISTGKLVNQIGKGIESSAFVAAHKDAAAKIIAAGF